MTGRLRRADGQTAIEYAGLLAVLAIVIAAIAALDIPRHIGRAVTLAVCSLEGERDCASSGESERTRLARKLDPDGDGLSSRQERRLGTAPDKSDSDADGIPDGVEVRRKLDPRSRDTDVDGIQDARELALERTKRTDPLTADSDGDGLLDGAELAAGSAAWDDDADRDGRGGLSDGLTDYEEIFEHGTDPTRIDTDGDGEGDGDEVRAGTNPLVDERSLGAKVAVGVTGFLLDDPSNLSPKGIVKGLGDGLGAVGRKLGIGAGKGADEVVTETAENLAAARKRRQAAEEAVPAAKPAPRNWLRGTDGNAAPVPDSVKARLRARTFSSPDQFREEFWKAAAEDPALASQFSAGNVTRMRKGLAPVAPRSQHYGKHRSYVLHHRTPVARGGARYDPDNIMVVSPRYHQEVLDGSYHFGNSGG